MSRKTGAQLNREVNQVLGSTPAVRSRKKRAVQSEKHRKIDGYEVLILDYKTPGAMRFAAFYEVLPASVVGRGETEAAAIAALKRAADAYGKQRQDEVEREDWAQHEADKEEALRRGDY